VIPQNQIMELAAWGLDESPDRCCAISADDLDSSRAQAEGCIQYAPAWEPRSALVQDAPEHWSALLSGHAERNDMRTEFEGLDWHIGIVDLRSLVSFQRRLVLPEQEAADDSGALDWPSRVDLAFPARRDSEFIHVVHTAGLTLYSENPDINVRFKQRSDAAEPFAMEVHHGSPFMEVASFRGRWILRDGYHRAFRLLCAHVFEVPAVIIHAKTLEELGATQPWFFPEETLFCRRPPAVRDFTSVDLVFRGRRPVRRKVVRITITEDFEPLNYELERKRT
jgi:hypothetical protein